MPLASVASTVAEGAVLAAIAALLLSYATGHFLFGDVLTASEQFRRREAWTAYAATAFGLIFLVYFVNLISSLAADEITLLAVTAIAVLATRWCYRKSTAPGLGWKRCEYILATFVFGTGALAIFIAAVSLPVVN